MLWPRLLRVSCSRGKGSRRGKFWSHSCTQTRVTWQKGNPKCAGAHIQVLWPPVGSEQATDTPATPVRQGLGQHGVQTGTVREDCPGAEGGGMVWAKAGDR